MSEPATVSEWIVRGGGSEFLSAEEPEIIYEGPAGCIAGESVLDGQTLTIREMSERGFRPVVMTTWGAVGAEVPFRKGRARLYRVRLTSGRSFLATADHVLHADGVWRLLRDLAPGMELRSWSRADENRYRGTIQDSQAGCPVCPRCGGGLLHDAGADGQASSPSQSDAHERSRNSSLPGGLASTAEDTRTCPASVRPSIVYSGGREPHAPSDESSGAGCATLDGGFHSCECTDSHAVYWSRLHPQFRAALSRVQPCEQSFRDDDNTRRFQVFPCGDYTDEPVFVESIEYERTDDFYDLHVPGAQQYFLSGVLHHNSGKSTVSCIKWVSLCLTYPGVRIFACRKHRASCTESLLPILDALIPAHELKNPRLQRAGRHSYDFVNGSTIVIGGLDQVTKTLSTQFSVVYVQEATEITENDWEFLQRPLRDPVVPHPDGPYPNGQKRYWTQAVAECNPDAPTHWLNRRANEGKMRRILSRHEDNPTITEDYLKKLRALTGVRRSRLYEGKWVAAEGQIWPEFDPNIHVLSRLPNREQWRYFGSIDWGFRAPGCMQVWAVDKFNWMYRVAEVYQSERTDDWWLDTAHKLRGEFDVEYWVADPEDAGAIAKFRRAGLSVLLADKNIEYGLDAVRQRLAPDRITGMPKMFFLDIVKARRRGVCPICSENRWPTCFEDEVGAYVYTTIDADKKIKEVPDPKCFDHSCDTTRYAVTHMDPRDMRPRKPVPKYHPNSFAMVEGYEEIMRKSRSGEYENQMLEDQNRQESERLWG